MSSQNAFMHSSSVNNFLKIYFDNYMIILFENNLTFCAGFQHIRYDIYDGETSVLCIYIYTYQRKAKL